MAKRLRIVLIDWVDRDHFDTDEIRIYAESNASAIVAAKRKWRLTVGAAWPHCHIEKVEILTPERLREFA